MKREFLQNLKVGEQSLSKEVIDAIMEESGAEPVRVYPILFELNQEKKIRVLEETGWGAPLRVELSEQER